MPTNYPTSLDTFTNPTSTDDLNTAGVLHDEQHANVNDAVEALEARVGITGAPTFSRSSLLVAASNAPATWIAAADYTCDGTADDVQIQAALDALPAAGGTVMLSPGLFTVAVSAGSPVTGDSLTTPYCVKITATHGAVTLRGAGMGATTIKLANSQGSNTIPLLIRGASTGKRTAQTVISDLAFEGNDANQTAWTDFGMIEVAYADRVTIERCYLFDSPNFMVQIFRDSQLFRVQDNRFVSSASKHAVRIESHKGLIRGNEFAGVVGATAGSLLTLTTNADVSIISERIVVLQNQFVGGFIPLTISGGRRHIVTHNVFQDVTDTTSNAAIDVDKYTSSGPVYWDTYENVIAYNTIYNIRNGIRLTGDANGGSLRNRVIGNMIIDGPDAALATGIKEEGAISDYNEIINNRIISASTAISTVGANTIVRDNFQGTSFVGHSHGAADITSGTVATARLGSGAADNTTFLRGDQTWATPAGSGNTLTIKEIDGTPSAAFSTLELPNGTLSDQGSGVARYTPSTGPSLDVTVVNAGGSGSYTTPVIAAAEAELVARFRTKIDLTNCTQARIIVYNVTTNAGGAGITVYPKYSTDQSTWSHMDGGSSGTPAVTLAASNTLYVSSWINLATAAKADVFLSVFTSGGNGSVAAVLHHITWQFM